MDETDKHLILSQGIVCKALLEYYFQNKKSDVISLFIKKDKALIRKYGYSSIDLFQFPDNFQGNFTTTNSTPGHSKLTIDLINHFKSKEMFILTKQSNGHFYVKPTEKFLQSHKTLKLNMSN